MRTTFQKLSTMPDLPIDRFASCADPVTAWKDWTAHLAPLFEVSPMPETHVGASVAMRNYNLGSVLVGTVSAPANRLERTARMAAQQGLDHVLIQYYRNGTSRVRSAHGEVRVGPSDFLIYDLAQPIAVSASPVDAVNILLPRAVLGDRREAIGGLHGSVFGETHDTTAQLFGSYLRTVVAHGDSLPPEAAAGVAEAAATLCRVAIPNAAPDAAAMERRTSIEVRAFIQRELAVPDLGPEMICARFGLSRATLYRQFAADDGVQTYIRDRRLAWAMRLLTAAGGGPRPRVSSVAYATGFSDEKSFSRAFKRRFGFLPREAAAGASVVPPRTGAGESRLGAWIRQLDL